MCVSSGGSRNGQRPGLTTLWPWVWPVTEDLPASVTAQHQQLTEERSPRSLPATMESTRSWRVENRVGTWRAGGCRPCRLDALNGERRPEDALSGCGLCLRECGHLVSSRLGFDLRGYKELFPVILGRAPGCSPPARAVNPPLCVSISPVTFTINISALSLVFSGQVQWYELTLIILFYILIEERKASF
jgi:hypothetical protein